MKQRSRLIDAIALVLALNLVPFGAIQSANAAVIGSLEHAEHAARGDRIERIQSFLAREAVRSELLGHGVNPADVETRLSSLTDSELALLEQRIDALPAGGDLLAVIGVVFVVLLILELVGVTNIFQKI